MSRTQLEFMGKLSLLERLRTLEMTVARLQRYAGDAGEGNVLGDPRSQGSDTSKATPPLRQMNVKWVNGFEATAVARPFSLVPLSAAGDWDVRRAGGGTIYTNRVVAGAGSDIAVMDGVNSTYRFWAGASAGANAAFSVTKAGAVKATSGSVGGWTIGATTIDGASATLDSAGSIVIGSGDDVVVLSAIDSTRRLWVGAANPATAPFRVTKAGALTTTNITATGGTVGGFTLASNAIKSGSFGMDQANLRYSFENTNTYIGYSAGISFVQANSERLNIVSTGISAQVALHCYAGATIDSGDLNVIDGRIAVSAGSATIYGDIESVTGNVSVAADAKVLFDGQTGNDYFKLNSSTGKVELYVGGILTASWP